MHLHGINAVGWTEPEMKAGIGGGLEAPAAVALSDLLASPGENGDRGPDAVAVRPGPLELKRDEVVGRQLRLVVKIDERLVLGDHERRRAGRRCRGRRPPVRGPRALPGTAAGLRGHVDERPPPSPW